MAYIGKEPIVGNFQKCDAITVVNGQAAYTLQVGSANVSPESVNHMIVSLNGVIQAPTTAYTVSGATLTFASNLATGDVIDFVILLGSVLSVGVPSDDTVGAAQIKDDLISGTTALASTPADTDEFLVSDAGTLKRIDYSLIKGGGKIGQVVTVQNTAVESSSSTSMATISDLSVDITPTATSSKILILSSLQISRLPSHIQLQLMRDTTAISIGDADSSRARTSFQTYEGGSDQSYGCFPHGHTWLDSPSSTSEITYSWQWRVNANTVYLNRSEDNTDSSNYSRTASSITVMEVLA